MEKAVRKKKDICSYTYEELAEEMQAAGEKTFRAKQIYQWLHVKLADSFEEMTNLSKSLREKLDEEYPDRPGGAGGEADLKGGSHGEIPF